jgi:hypothetical protein
MRQSGVLATSLLTIRLERKRLWEFRSARDDPPHELDYLDLDVQIAIAGRPASTFCLNWTNVQFSEREGGDLGPGFDRSPARGQPDARP